MAMLPILDGDGSDSRRGSLPAEDVGVVSRFMESWLSDEATDYRLLDDVSLPGLRTLVSIVADQCKEELPAQEIDRQSLLQRLARLLDDTFLVRTNGSRRSSDEVIVNSSKPWVEQIDNSGVHSRTEWQDKRMLGARKSITDLALRELRHSAGWKTKSQIAKELSISVHIFTGLIDMLIDKKRDELVEGGMEREAAERLIQQEYIAKTVHHAHWNRDSRDRNALARESSVVWVDLSPEAQRDVTNYCEDHMKITASNTDVTGQLLSDKRLIKKGMIPFEKIMSSYGLNGPNVARYRRVAITILEKMQQQRINELVAGGMPQEDAIRLTNEHIAIFKPRSPATKLTFRFLSPEASEAYSQALDEQFPDRVKKRHSRSNDVGRGC